MTKHKTIAAKLIQDKQVVLRTTVALDSAGHPPSTYWYRGTLYELLAYNDREATYKARGVTR